MNVPATASAPVFLDCDTGVDDSLALAYLVSSPAVRLVGVGTVSGNTSSEQAARNSLDLLALLGAAEVPVAIGARDHLAKAYDGGVPHIHGQNGVGGVDLPPSPHEPVEVSAARLLIEMSHEHTGDLHIVAIGPLTNLALALREDPTLPSRIRAVTIMGGAARAPGNITAVAEANIGNDPEAAAAVVEAGWDLTIVPLDVTMENVLHEEDRLALLASDVPAARALGEILDHYFDFYLPTYGTRSSALHDPLAAAVAAGGVTPTVAPRVPVVVDTTDGPGRGQTVVDLRGQRLGAVDHPGVRTRVVLATDRQLGPHLLEVITAPTRRAVPVEG
ncbi:nucleoside hydrolase [Microbacterium aquimaris]|uniref:Nucleoside hydrolase n=1 Tax=Microbacterium aquimaris TaxID=459816 RepID=A0ABU5N3U0_9MICO|nr:nucleoside hydrolase [Microbacterium aquimaris]MDZ8160760.1 nucleoside hydrolase [Microbacterium aquimaris]